MYVENILLPNLTEVYNIGYGTSCVNSDNSSTQSNDYQVKRKDSKKMSMNGTSFTQQPVMDFRGDSSEQQMMGMYQPVVIPEGMEGLIPHGYVQVEKESCAPRRTKKVTKCEHTNRKHYAKVRIEFLFHSRECAALAITKLEEPNSPGIVSTRTSCTTLRDAARIATFNSTTREEVERSPRKQPRKLSRSLHLQQLRLLSPKSHCKSNELTDQLRLHPYLVSIINQPTRLNDANF